VTSKDQQRGLNKPWSPGVSGNPAGRPKGIAAKAQEHADGAIAYFAKVLNSDSEKTSDRLNAAQEILDRAYGKAIAMSADVTNKLDQFDDEFLVGALDALRAAKRDRERDSLGTDPETEH
jgi:hypothetical protein